MVCWLVEVKTTKPHTRTNVRGCGFGQRKTVALLARKTRPERRRYRAWGQTDGLQWPKVCSFLLQADMILSHFRCRCQGGRPPRGGRRARSRSATTTIPLPSVQSAGRVSDTHGGRVFYTVMGMVVYTIMGMISDTLPPTVSDTLPLALSDTLPLWV